MTKKEVKTKHGNGIVLDTSTIINDPTSIISLQDAGQNKVHISRGVLGEIDGLKTRPDIGYDAREALRIIEREMLDGNPNFVLSADLSWRNMDSYDRKIVDNQIIALTNSIVLSNKKGPFEKVKLISDDTTPRIRALDVFRGNKNVEVEAYLRNERDVIRYNPPIEIAANKKMIKMIQKDGIVLGVDPDLDVFENQGVLFTYFDEDELIKVPAIKKKNTYVVIPWAINAAGIKPGTLSGEGKNWEQYFALQQLMDPALSLVFLLGGAGTGKTLLALAAAIQTRSQFRNILVTRPMVHLEDKDNMGFLPGDVGQKMGPWLRPIYQNLDQIKQINGNGAIIERMTAEKKIEMEPLDYIRGTTFWKCLLIVDEAQNLTPHQIKTIITRAGRGTKIVFTGDLDQIDRTKRLNARSSGINYAASGTIGEEMVGVTTFDVTVRSELVEMALRKLK